MGRFAKLNDDVQILARKILDNQDLCKLLYYTDTYPLEQPDLNTKARRELLYTRLLLFTSKMPLTEVVGSYIMLRVPRGKPTDGSYFLKSLLLFDIYTHEDSRNIRIKDDNGIEKAGDRVILIADKIDEFMVDMQLSIGQNNIDGWSEVANRDSMFSGYSVGYVDVDFRSQHNE